MERMLGVKGWCLAWCLLQLVAGLNSPGFHLTSPRAKHWQSNRPARVAQSARISSGRLSAQSEEEDAGTESSPEFQAADESVAVVEDEKVNVFRRAGQRFRASPLEHLLIPVIAAGVGWITNKLAVDMIFYPLQWTGIPLLRFPGNPFGLIGWQGIVPAKAAIMSGRIVDMVTTRLIDVPSVFRRLDPAEVATLMAPEVDMMASSIASEALPATLRRFLKGLGGLGLGLQSDSEMLRRLREIERQMLEGLTRDMQRNLAGILDVRSLVIEELSRDKRVLVDLFKKVGSAELRFLVNSGWYFGFLLGVIQMVAWMFCRSNWTLPLGGAIVGCLTNWFALKFIFEPVDPMPIFGGRMVLQGLFLKRQPEVSAEFAEYMSEHVLTSKKLWDSILHGPRSGRFYDLLDVRLRRAMTAACGVLKVDKESLPMEGICASVKRRLPSHIGALHAYTDKTLALRPLMKEKMKLMSTRDFEGILHPIFQEDELTLIIAGGVLGALAGWGQMWINKRADRRKEKEEEAAAAAAASGMNSDVDTWW